MSKFLIISIIIASILFLIMFFCVCKARKNFKTVKAILKPIKIKADNSVYNFFCDIQKQGNLQNVQIAEGNSYAFFPGPKIVTTEKECLGSNSVFDIAAVAHEMGHAYAQSKKSKYMSLWYGLSTFEKIFCWSIIPLFLVGLILGFIPSVQNIGTICLNLSSGISMVILIGRLITIPTEKEASTYGINFLEKSKILDQNELKMAKKMLAIALSTYVFAFYERLFGNFILAKKIIFKIFRIKTKPKKLNKKEIKYQNEMLELINLIQEDNYLYETQPKPQKEEKIIKMPHLED